MCLFYRLIRKRAYQSVQVAKPLILSLSFDKTKVDLLNDYSDLEPRKRLRKNNLRDVTSGLGFVSFNNLLACEPARPVCDCPSTNDFAHPVAGRASSNK